MSGIFKNFDKLVSASVLSKVNHGLIVKSPLQKYSPSWLYVAPGQRISKYRGQSVFELSQIAYQLTRENARHQEWLEQIKDNESATQELQALQQQHQASINDALSIIQLQLQSGISSSQPLETLTSYVFTLSQQNNQSANTQIFNEYLRSSILEKLQYASVQNLSDLVQGLVGLGINDTNVWSATLQALKSKTSQQLETVNYHAWELDQYEYTDKGACNYVGSTEQYYQDLAEGRGNGLSKARKTVYGVLEQVYFRAVNPFLFRESRPSYLPYNLDKEEDRQNLIKALKSVAGEHPEAAQILNQVGRL